MTPTQVKERYSYLAKEWGFTCKQLDDASKAIFNSHKETSSQKEFEEAMKQYLESTKKVKQVKVVFKKRPRPSGIAGVGSGFYVTIKINGKQCGILSGGKPRDKNATIQLSIKDPSNERCPWKWVFIDTDGIETEDEGRLLVQNIITDFVSKNTMYFFED